MQKKLIAIYKGFLSLTLMGITAIPLILLNLLTFNYSRKRISPFITSKSSRIILSLIGVKFKFPLRSEYPKHQQVYTFNHNSFLDVLILTALNIPNTRFILSEKTFRYPTLTLAAIAIGVFYVPQKHNVKRRKRFFEKMIERLDKNNYSICASSEGVHDFVNGIEEFNSEIYDMAMKTCKKMTCIFIKVPENNNPKDDFYFRKAKVEVDIFNSISLDKWNQNNLMNKINEVRNLFIKKYAKEHQKERI